MVSFYSENISPRKPVENYRARVRVVMVEVFRHARAIAGPENWKEPTEEMFDIFIDNFSDFMNQAVERARRHGFAIERFSKGPLTEKEMQYIENVFLKNLRKYVFIE